MKERGNAFFQRKQYDQALEWYTKAIAEDGSVHAVYTNRAAAYFNLKKVRTYPAWIFPSLMLNRHTLSESSEAQTPKSSLSPVEIQFRLIIPRETVLSSIVLSFSIS